MDDLWSQIVHSVITSGPVAAVLLGVLFMMWKDRARILSERNAAVAQTQEAFKDAAAQAQEAYREKEAILTKQSDLFKRLAKLGNGGGVMISPAEKEHRESLEALERALANEDTATRISLALVRGARRMAEGQDQGESDDGE